ncbi:MAG: radical SAM protein [Candidatus Hydrothermarchaeales archaeon]
MHEAWCYTSDGDSLKCELCIINCKIREGDVGFCKTRKNIGGKLYNTIYGKLSSFSIDYVEKTPLYHFHPNSRFLTLGSISCNMKCKFCLAWSITQVPPEEVDVTEVKVSGLINAARALECKGMVYTHSEPALNLEYYAEIMREGKKKGLTNVLATNGLVSIEAFKKIAGDLDAVALTIKGDEDFYRQVCDLKVNGVLEHLTRLMNEIKEQGIHLEVVSLVIPGYEGQASVAVNFAKKAGVPLIFLRFFPCYAMDDLQSPSEEILETVLNNAYRSGVKYAYVENIFSHPGKNTYCEVCKAPLVKREGYGVVEWSLVGGKCIHCGASIPMVGERA